MTELELKAAVRSRDGMRCTKCRMSNAAHKRKTGRILDVHRLVPGSEYAVDGCVTLCHKCHMGAHRREPCGTVRMNASVAKRIRRVAAHLGVRPGEFIAAALQHELRKDEARLVAELRRSLAA